MNTGSILIVDDDKNILLSLSIALEKLNVPVETAASGAEAMEKLGQGEYELMLLDLRMPGMDGMEVLRRVSQQRPEIKVIIITAYGSIDLAVEAMKLGAVDFLQKPFDVAEVRGVVRRLLVKTWGRRDMNTIWPWPKIVFLNATLMMLQCMPRRQFFLPETGCFESLGGDCRNQGQSPGSLGLLPGCIKPGSRLCACAT